MPIYRIQTRRDTNENWNTNNPALQPGEMGLRTTNDSNGSVYTTMNTPVIKIGD